MPEKACCCPFFNPFYAQAWDLWNGHNFDAAKQAAQSLLAQPCLSKSFMAGMHLLLAACPGKHVDNAETAIALYTELLEHPNLTESRRDEFQFRLEQARAFGEIARQDHDDPPCEVYARLYHGKHHQHGPGPGSGGSSGQFGAHDAVKEEQKGGEGDNTTTLLRALAHVEGLQHPRKSS